MLINNGLAAVSVAIGGAVAAVVQVAQSHGLPPAVLYSVLSGAVCGGVAFGLLKGRVERAQDRADTAHERHDKVDGKLDAINLVLADVRHLVGILVGHNDERLR